MLSSPRVSKIILLSDRRTKRLLFTASNLGIEQPAAQASSPVCCKPLKDSPTFSFMMSDTACGSSELNSISFATFNSGLLGSVWKRDVVHVEVEKNGRILSLSLWDPEMNVSVRRWGVLEEDLLLSPVLVVAEEFGDCTWK